MQVIILCGGKGTRLRSAIPEGLPKAMADINGKPFLWYLLNRWAPYVDRFLLAVGHGHQFIIDYFGPAFGKSELCYYQTISGTEHAVSSSLYFFNEHFANAPEDIFVINGDTWFEIDPVAMMKFHKERGENMTASFSMEERCHAGVDIIKRRPGYTRRVAIYSSWDDFIDIGTPQTLEAFREKMR